MSRILALLLTFLRMHDHVKQRLYLLTHTHPLPKLRLFAHMKHNATTSKAPGGFCVFSVACLCTLAVVCAVAAHT